jgi:hypothetical protein
MAVSGTSDAHTDVLHQIAGEVLEIIKDPSQTEAKVVRYINRGLGEIVAKLAARRVYLPSLATEAEVETLTATDTVALPADWHGNLHGAFDLTRGRGVRVMPWTELQRMRGAGPIKSGLLRGVAAYGRQLRYWLVPDMPHRISLQYHRLPSPLVVSTDKPFELPVELSTKLLIDYACAAAFSAWEQDQGDPRVQTNDYRQQFEAALDVLAREIGPWPKEADPIVNEMMWEFTC